MTLRVLRSHLCALQIPDLNAADSEIGDLKSGPVAASMVRFLLNIQPICDRIIVLRENAVWRIQMGAGSPRGLIYSRRRILYAVGFR